MRLFSAFLRCALAERKPPETPSEIPDANLSYNDTEVIVPGGESSDNEDSEAASTDQPTQQSGGFVVKLAKYDYNNTIEKQNDLLSRHDTNYGDVSIAILDVTNETDKNYSVKIVGKYLDENGKVLKTETQEWDQFAAGWQKYFLFRPRMQFDRFEYTVETTEYNGDCWKCGYSIPFASLITDNRMIRPVDLDYPGIPSSVEGLRVNVREIVDIPFRGIVSIGYLVLFDASGQVIGVYQTGQRKVEPQTTPDIWTAFSVYYPDDPKMDEWPERFQGNVTGIIVTPWLIEETQGMTP